MPLASLTTGKKHFLYWDEYEPVAFATFPEKAPTIPFTTFKKLLAGQVTEIQVSQTFAKHNPDFKWARGAALTAPLADLWTPTRNCPAEQVRHMQNRVVQFDALAPLTGTLRDIPMCAESWSAWLVSKAASFATRMPARFNERPIEDEDL